MTKKRDIKADQKATIELVNNVENVQVEEQSWLGHAGGAGIIDYALLKGASMSKLLELTGQPKERIKNHFSELKKEHGLGISNEDGVFRFNLNSKNMNEHLYKLKEEFLETWSIERLKNITLEEYTNLDKETSFCYWLEARTTNLGSIWGGSAYKFGIYKRKNKNPIAESSYQKSDGEYAWSTKYGETKEKAFYAIKSIIIEIAIAAQKNDISIIENIDLGFAYKWKIAFLYSNYNVLNAFKEDAIQYFGEFLNLNIKKNTPVYELQNLIISNKPTEKEFYTYTSDLWKKYQLLKEGKNLYLNQKKKFEAFLKSEVKPTTVKSYLSFINSIGVLSKKLNLIEKSFYEIAQIDQLEEIIDELKNNQPFINKNEKGHNGLSAALNKYHTFLENLNSLNPENTINRELMKPNKPLNQILFGPPGTGKTYQTISDSIAIVNPSFDLNQERAIIRKEYNKLTKEGKIVFTTFHQSMSYEDFIEGIKPVLNQENKDVTYDIHDGIFKTIADKAKGIKGEIRTDPANVDFRNCNYFKMSVGGKNRKDVHDWCIANNQVALGYGGNNDLNLIASKDWKSYKKEFQDVLPHIAEQSSYSITATHTFKYWMKKGDVVLISLGNHIIDAIGVIKGDYEYVESPEFPYHHTREVEWIATDLEANPSLFVDKKISQQTIYQFNNDDIKIDYLESIISQKASTQPIQNYVVIIDEINRGNISAIFGELITLLEEDKRKGNDEALSVTLPYSQESFSVPKNLYIIGTMNTADRSVEALDTALRRRFEFKEMMPDLDVIKNEEVDGVKLSEVLKTINERIELLIDRDHTIGHSYFCNSNTPEALANAFNNKIIPLLQEYFYGDYGKIGLVLGKGFIDKKENKEISFADFKYDNSEDFITPTFVLKQVDSTSIIDAVNILLGKKEVQEAE